MARRIVNFDKDRPRKTWAASRQTKRELSSLRQRRRDNGIPLRWVWGVLAAIVVVMIARPDHGWNRLIALWSPPASQSTSLVGLAPATPRSAIAARPMPICDRGPRINCVVDGDTFWIEGEKVRVETIDAPEVNGRCSGEIALAARATRRLVQLLSGRSIELSRNGKDRYGRTLARVRTPGGDVGAILIGEGLAQRWAGRKSEWCSA